MTGKIIVAGHTAGHSTNYTLTRYNTDGTVDTSFGSGGTTETVIGAEDQRGIQLTVQSNGSIIASGFVSVDSGSLFELFRFDRHGTRDMTYGGTGTVVTGVVGHDSASALALQSGGSLVFAGSSEAVDGPTHGKIVLQRYTADGALDTGFGTVAAATASPPTSRLISRTPRRSRAMGNSWWVGGSTGERTDLSPGAIQQRRHRRHDLRQRRPRRSGIRHHQRSGQHRPVAGRWKDLVQRGKSPPA